MQTVTVNYLSLLDLKLPLSELLNLGIPLPFPYFESISASNICILLLLGLEQLLFFNPPSLV